ncbi:MAG: transketolase C-terminal domain-containing protein, partial [Candidatus Riflebacteria bacterium]
IEKFPIGGLKLLKKAAKPTLTVISSGVIIHEVLEAVKKIDTKDQIQIVDLYCLKPFPTSELKEVIKASAGKVAVFEEHAPEGGVGAAVALHMAGSISSFKHVAVTSVPKSGTPEELLASFGLSAEKIAETLTKLLA